MSDQATDTNTDASADKPQEGEAKNFDADYVKKLRDEAARYRTEAKANADAAKRLAELEESQKTETQRLSDGLAAEKAQREQAEQSLLRLRVAVAKGLPADLVDRLRGDSEEELSADADSLLALVGKQQKPGLHVAREGGNSGGTSSTADLFAAAIKDQLQTP
jgi:hypothetical protein